MMRGCLKGVALTIAIVLGLTSCGGVRSANAAARWVTSATSCPTLTCRHIELIHVGVGEACNVNGSIGTITYSAYDVAKAGVPRVSTHDAEMVRRILHYVHPTTLRFAYAGTEFVVFDAYPGLCNGGAPFYVLNGGCNKVFSITDTPYTTAAGGDMGCVNAPRPWIIHDRGSGKTPWAQYDNGPAVERNVALITRAYLRRAACRELGRCPKARKRAPK